MNAPDFVRELAAAAPPMDALARVGINRERGVEIQRSYNCLPRRGNRSGEIAIDCAVALVEEWDMSQVQVGMLRFDDQSSPCPLGIRIGILEVDPLVVMRATGEVAVVDENEPSFVMSYAAENGGKLLDALLLAAQYCTQSLLNEIGYEDMAAARAAASDCADAAGGPKYKNFYCELLAADG